MPRFKIVIEDARIELRAKVFEAATLEEAREMAEGEAWDSEEWEDYDSSTNCEIRDDLSDEVVDECPTCGTAEDCLANEAKGDD